MLATGKQLRHLINSYSRFRDCSRQSSLDTIHLDRRRVAVVYSDDEGNLYFNTLHFLLRKGPQAILYSRNRQRATAVMFAFAAILMVNMIFFFLHILVILGVRRFELTFSLSAQFVVGVSALVFMFVTASGTTSRDIRLLKRRLGLSLIFYATATSIFLAGLADAVAVSKSYPSVVFVLPIYVLGLLAALWLACFNLFGCRR